MVCRGVRGATTVTIDDKEAVLRATRELLALMIRLNGIQPEDVASATFTTTPDLVSVFPALGARQLGWLDVPLMCGHEIDVTGALPKCVRILIHWNTHKSQKEIQHVYLGDAQSLRPDKTLGLTDAEREELHAWIEEQLTRWG